MSFLKAMQNRYTTKMYDSTKKIEPSKLDELKEVLRMCPSSINSQPWEFVFVSDTQMKAKLAEASLYNAEKILNCDTLVVFNRIDNIEFFEDEMKERLPETAVAYYNRTLKSFSDNEKKAWFDRQVYLSLGVFLSACAKMQIDSTPMEGIEIDKYNQILGHNDFTAVLAVAIGYRDSEDFNQPDRKPKSRKDLDLVVKSI